ncbi:MAG: nicotinate (nicotinamide) nucleotide adenylyltransferase [Oscillospiraceae bacterium]|jgi:nicotinate-nucleotide adenylyltransferase|nr:nicotinate (nicotinamide) nucleotide adenylyltransferase [Oscillospiraceae bacterium]
MPEHITRKIGIYGGAFNPPHSAHVLCARCAVQALELDRLIVVPSGISPHKPEPRLAASAKDRLELCKIAFGDIARAEVSDIEVQNTAGRSYTADTLRIIMEREQRRGEDLKLYLICGTDMFVTLPDWYDAEFIFKSTIIAHCARPGRTADEGAPDFPAYAKAVTVGMPQIEVSSSQLRAALAQGGGLGLMHDAVYAYIVKNRLYGVEPSLAWLRRKAYELYKPKRVLHAAGCEEEALRLCERWYGASATARDADNCAQFCREAQTAAMLHDATKKLALEEQLALCEKYGVKADEEEKRYANLLHGKTAAAIARAEFGVNERVAGAIAFHTTARADMNLLEKIMYLADYIEPTREPFDGLSELRQLAYENLDGAVYFSLCLTADDLKRRGIDIHKSTAEAIHFYS